MDGRDDVGASHLDDLDACDAFAVSCGNDGTAMV